MSYLVDLTHRICGSGRPADVLLAELAALQHGVVALWQLYLLGFTWRAVESRVLSGRLHRVHRGVYAVGHPKLTPRGHHMAAVLAYGKDALLSHRSNAALRGLLPDARTVIDVTAPGRTRRGRVGTGVVHQPRGLHPDDLDVFDGIPCTAVPLLLLDVAETAPQRQLERVFEAAERERQLDMRKVGELMERSGGRRGLRPLRALLAQFEEPPPNVRSRLERRFFALCRGAGVPVPAVNVWVGDCEVDMLWDEQRVIVELDGWDTHRTRAAFERDRARDVRLQAMGYTVLRFTWRQLAHEPEVLLAAVGKLLGARPAVVL